ncbi:Crossover junction endonuclease mus81, variant 2 [Balamuthia mandrillaris]
MSDLEAVGIPLLGHRKTLLLASQELKEAVLHNQELQRNRKKRRKKNKQKTLLQRRTTLPSISSTASISSPALVSASLSASSTPISRSLSVDSLSQPSSSSSSRSPSFQVAPPRHFESENEYSATSSTLFPTTALTTSTTKKGAQPAKVPKLIALKGTLPVVDSMFILMNSSEESYAKGQATFQRGAIASLILNGREILAEVEGGGTYGRGRLHKVNLSLTKPKSLLSPNNNGDDGEEERAMMKKIVMVKRAVCSCSYDREGWCKHIVATLLCLLHKQNAETTPTRRRQVQQSSIREFAADKTSPSTSSTAKKRKNDEDDDDKEEGDDDRTKTETRHKRTKRRQPDQTQMRGKQQKRTEVIPRKYIPRYRSGAWALLQALIRAEQEEIVRNYPGYLSKKQLLDLAGPYCDSSFYAESTGLGSGQNFYTAWNSMATLIGKGLVQKKGAPAKYSLTESGRQLAHSLLAAEQEETTNNNPSSKWHQNDEDEENDDEEKETERTKQKTEKEMKNKVLLKLDDTSSSSSDNESAATKNKAKEDDEEDQDEKQDKDPTWIGSGSTVNDDTMMMEEPILWAPSASTTVFIAEPNPYSPQYRPEEGPEQKHLSPLLPGPSEEIEKDNEPQESSSSRFDDDVLAVHTTFATPASTASMYSLSFNFEIEGEQKEENGVTNYTTLLRAKTEDCSNKKERSSSTCATTVIELSESDDEKLETDGKHGQMIEPRKYEEKKEEHRTIKVENVLQVLSEEEEEKDKEENEDDMLSVGKDDRTNSTSSFSSSQSLFLDLTDIEPQTSPTKSFPDEFLPTSTSASQTSTKEKTKRFAQGSIITSTFSSNNKKQANATPKHREKVITSFEIVLVLDNREIHEKPAYKTMFKRLRESGILCEARALALGDMLWIARIAYQTKLHSHQRKDEDAKENEGEDEEESEEDLELDQRWDETDSGEEEYVLGQIAERKTMADMLASIQDKRYQEQKFRLSQLCAANQVSTVLYILEGANVAMNSDNSNSHKDVDALQMELLRDAIVETQTVDGFYVVRTDNERHTANYLRELTHHIESLYHRSKWAYRHSSSCSSSSAAASRSSSGDEPASLFLWNNRSMLSYSRFNLLASKSGNLTLKHLFAKQLMQIPNCQAAKARAIVDSYSSPAALFEAYVAMEEEDKAREEREERRDEELQLTKNKREKEKRRRERRKEELLKDLRMEEEEGAGNSSHVHVAVGPATSKRVYHFYNDLT